MERTRVAIDRASTRTNANASTTRMNVRCGMRRNASKVGAHATRYDASALDANADDVDVARERDGSSTEDVVLCFTQAMFVRTIAVVRFGEKDGGGEERMMAKERERACAYRSVEEFERACASVGEKVDVRKEGTYIGKDLTRNARAVYAMRATSRSSKRARKTDFGTHVARRKRSDRG